MTKPKYQQYKLEYGAENFRNFLKRSEYYVYIITSLKCIIDKANSCTGCAK